MSFRRFGSSKNAHSHVYQIGHRDTEDYPRAPSLPPIQNYPSFYIIHSISLHCGSLRAAGMSRVISCSNRTGLTQRLIDMQQGNPTIAANIYLCALHLKGIICFPSRAPAQSQTHTHTQICSVIHVQTVSDLICSIRKYVCRASEINAVCLIRLSVVEIKWFVGTGSFRLTGLRRLRTAALFDHLSDSSSLLFILPHNGQISFF